MENYDWQSWAAISVVMATIVTFGVRMFGRKPQSSECGGSCGCSKKWSEKDFVKK